MTTHYQTVVSKRVFADKTELVFEPCTDYKARATDIISILVKEAGYTVRQAGYVSERAWSDTCTDLCTTKKKIGGATVVVTVIADEDSVASYLETYSDDGQITGIVLFQSSRSRYAEKISAARIAKYKGDQTDALGTLIEEVYREACKSL